MPLQKSKKPPVKAVKTKAAPAAKSPAKSSAKANSKPNSKIAAVKKVKKPAISTKSRLRSCAC